MPQRRYTLSDFDFALPPELIAQAPAAIRSASRLLEVHATHLADHAFTALPALLQQGDVAVFNDTRVIRARVTGTKLTGGNVEILVERVLDNDAAWVQMRASHPAKPGSTIDLADGARAHVLGREGRLFHLRFEIGMPLLDWLERHGSVPLPPYIARTAGDDDAQRYQTIYAQVPGAVAAPTAGLHFDAPLLGALAERGVSTAFVTLHVGAGTFQPVTSEDLAEHRMHSEWFHIPAATAQAIADARSRGGRVLAVGTTSLRAIESAAAPDGRLAEGAAETALFITPGHAFRVTDLLLTNFHLPRSTLLMLVSAFAGYDTIRSAYAHAIRERYRFFSYGDAMLLTCASPVPLPGG